MLSREKPWHPDTLLIIVIAAPQQAGELILPVEISAAFMKPEQ